MNKSLINVKAIVDKYKISYKEYACADCNRPHVLCVCSTGAKKHLIDDLEDGVKKDSISRCEKALIERVEEWIKTYAYMSDTPANRKRFKEDSWYPGYTLENGEKLCHGDPLRTVVTHVGLDQLRRILQSYGHR